MKKKIASKLLLVATVLASLSAFVSCKDYDEDSNADLLSKTSSLQDVYNKQMEELSRWKTSMEEQQKKNKDSIWIIAQDWMKKSDYVTGGKLADCIVRDQNLGYWIDQLNKLINYGGTGNIQDLIDAINNANTTAANAATAAANAATAAANAATAASNAQASADNANGRIDSLNSVIQGWSPDMKETVRQVAEALERAKNDSMRIDQIEKNYATKVQLDSLGEDFKDSVSILRTLINQTNYKVSENHREMLDSISKTKQYAQSLYNELKKTMIEETNWIKDSIAGLDSRLDNVDIRLGDLEEAYKNADKALNVRIDSLRDVVDALTTKVLRNSEKVDSLCGVTSKIQNALAKLVTGVIVQGAESPVIGQGALPVGLQTNVLAGFYGYAGSAGVRFPTDRQPYYADWNSNGTSQRLTNKDLEMVGKVNEYTAADGAFLAGSNADNAGTLYMTINPNTVNLTGLRVELENSVMETCPINLTPIQPSNKRLTFGWTRGAAANGFYETKASIDAANVTSLKPRVSVKDLKEVMAELKKVRNSAGVKEGLRSVNVSKIAYNLYTEMNDVLDAQAIKVSWRDDLTNEVHSVYSQYNVAATAIKPLSFATLKDLNMTTFPGYGTVENFINRVVGKVSYKLPSMSLNLGQAPKISKIEMVELTPELKAKFKVEVNIDTTFSTIKDGATIETAVQDENGNWVSKTVYLKDLVKENGVVKLYLIREIDMTDAVEELYGNLTDPIKNFNKTVDDLNAYLQNVNDELNRINGYVADVQTSIDDAKESVRTKLLKYLDQLNTVVCKIVNSANKTLQPLAIVKTSDSFVALSKILGAPTKVNSTTFTLVPTTYTGELVCPALKKHVAVTDVWENNGIHHAQGGNAACKAALQAVNAQSGLNTVVDGSTKTMQMTLKKGYVYEIAYSALDFYGKVAVRKFYVTVK